MTAISISFELTAPPTDQTIAQPLLTSLLSYVLTHYKLEKLSQMFSLYEIHTSVSVKQSLTKLGTW